MKSTELWIAIKRTAASHDSLGAVAAALRAISIDLAWYAIGCSIEHQDSTLAPDEQTKALLKAWDAGHWAAAFDRARPLAETGHIPAMYIMGICYHLGRFFAPGIAVTTDIGKSVEWLTKAADAGDPGACDYLGRLWATQLNDPDKAAMYISRAKSMGWDKLPARHRRRASMGLS